ncbi:MAG TPA: glycosyltransferase family 2 protein [Candidatus Limnocylindria bacterium]|nr:glycosyltransferase family 2 protein [Candidatus Limnocylindria bacterium]
MRRFALLIAVAAFAAIAALLDATTRGSFVAPQGPPTAVDGTGPILVASPPTGHRGAIGRGHVALLISPRSPDAARDIAAALAHAGLSATFALTAEVVISDASLAGDLRKAGHDVAYAGIAASDAASLPEPFWRLAETLGLRMVESAAGERLALYAPARLLDDHLDEVALTIARRASALGLVSVAPATAPTDDTATDGLVVIRNAGEIGRFAGQGSQTRLVSLRSLAGLDPEPPLDPLRGAAGELTLALARLARWAGDALAAAAVLAAALYLARLVVVVFVAARHAGRPRIVATASPRVAVLVPAYREELVISRCVASLHESVYPNLDIVVIDDGSDDGTAAAARQAAGDDGRVTVLQKPNGGKASALNHGFSATRAEVIVVVDADSIVESDAIAELVKPLAVARVGAVAGNVKVGNRWSVLGAFQHLEYVMGINVDRRFFDEIDAISVVPGALGAFRREALEAVGGFPTDTLAEDADLTVAIGVRGFHVRHAPYALAWTEVPTAIGALRRQRFRWTYGTLQVLWKHRGAPVRRGATNVGRLGLPYLLVFGYLLPLLSPAVDGVLVYGAIVAGARPEVVALFVWVTVLQLLAAAVALRLDGENVTWAAAALPMQLGYRQFLSFITASALWAAVAGFPVGWGKLRRLGLPAELGRR